jgi:hypothetical protein
VIVHVHQPVQFVETPTLPAILAALSVLTAGELAAIVEAATAQLAQRQAEPAAGDADLADAEPADVPDVPAGTDWQEVRRRGLGWTEQYTVTNKHTGKENGPYARLCWRSGGKKWHHYLGKVKRG